MRQSSLGLFVLFLVVSLPVTATAQTGTSKAPAKAPTAEAILDGYVKAIGGRKAIEKHTSLTMTGTLEVVGVGLKGTIEIISKEPSRIAVTTTIDGIGTSRQGYDGKSGWSVDPLSGIRDMDSREIALVERSVFSSDVRWREVWKSAEYVGIETIDGRSVHVVRLTPSANAGSPTTNFYDAETGLLSRTEMVIETSAATMPVTTTLSDYRKIGDVLIAMRMVQALPTATLVTQFSDVKFDLKIDDAVFAKPTK